MNRSFSTAHIHRAENLARSSTNTSEAETEILQSCLKSNNQLFLFLFLHYQKERTDVNDLGNSHKLKLVKPNYPFASH